MVRFTLIVLAMVSSSISAYGQDYEHRELTYEKEVSDLATSSPPGPRIVTVKGRFSNEQFLKIHKGKSIRVLLDHGKWSAITRADGTFSIYEVPEGIHFLHVNAIGWHFDTVRVEVTHKGRVKASLVGGGSPQAAAAAASAANGGAGLGERVRLVGPKDELRLEPVSRVKFFEEREKFDPVSQITRNPMIMMMILMVGVSFMMPKVMESMPPEDLDRIRGQMRGGAASGGKRSPPAGARRVAAAGAARSGGGAAAGGGGGSSDEEDYDD